MTDQEIISEIRAGKREEAIKTLYREYPKILANIRSTGGDEEIAREIFHDSLILLIEKVSKPDFELTSRLSTYLYGINRFLWKNELRKQRRNPELEWKDTLILSAEELDYSEEKEEKIKLLDNVLSKVTERCKKIFELFYHRKENMEQIAKELQFSSVNSAKTQKYKCMESAIAMARQLQNGHLEFRNEK